MSPIDWARRPLQRYFNFKDRAPRAEYWWFYLGTIIVTVLAIIIDGILGFGGAETAMPLGPVYGLVALGLIIPSIAVTVRRLHDTDRSGWWILMPIVPYILMLVLVGGAAATGSLATVGVVGIVSVLLVLAAAIALLVFMILPGTRGPNRFGPDPYGADVEQVFA